LGRLGLRSSGVFCIFVERDFVFRETIV